MKQKLSKHIFTVVIVLFLIIFIIWLIHPRSNSKQFTPEIETLTTTTTSSSTSSNNQQK